MTPTPKLRARGLTKRYGDFVALAPTDLEVAQGEFLTLLGPSGSGKTTLLSLIAGLAVPDGGQLLIGDHDVTYGPPYERDVGMVFQNYALFPHMTIEENIAFPLKMRKLDATLTRRRVAEALEMVRLPQVNRRFPKELSGGQQQRIALARCLVYRPSIILMDEPLGALDKNLRDQMQLEIKRIHRETRTTVVYVTHDQEEAMTMSDRICLMNGGRIEQLGSPSDLYFRPRTLFVAQFLGESNLLPATVTAVAGERVDVTLADGASFQVTGNGQPFALGSKVRVMVRPQNVVLDAADGAAPGLRGKVLDSMITGSLTKLYVTPLNASGAESLVVCYPTAWPSQRYTAGDEVLLHWRPADAVAVPEPA